MPSRTKTRPATPPSKRPRTHAEINEFRRHALMEGMIESLSLHGVAGTTVRTICDAAGSSRGLIGHYYESKDELMAASLKYLFEATTRQVQAELEKLESTAYGRLRALPEVLFSANIFTERNRTAFLCFWHEIRFNASVRRANRELYRGYAARTGELFSAAARERNREIDARRAAVGLIALTDGMWLGLSIHERVVSRGHAVEICQAYVDQALA